MGALQKIRSKSTLLVVVIAGGLLAFVIPWGEIAQFRGEARNKAFVVNGDVVKFEQYGKRLEEAQNMAKMRTEDGQLSEQQVAQVKNEVFQTMVTENILTDQSEKLGLDVTDKELNDMVHGINVSPVIYELFGNPQTGQLDREGLNRMLAELNKPLSADANMRQAQEASITQWNYIENRMRFARLEEKYAALVAGSVIVNNIEARAYYEDSKNVADIAYVSADYDQIADADVQVTDAELQALYNVRKENFLSKYPSRTLSYVKLNIAPDSTDYAEARAHILEIREELVETTNPGMVVNQYASGNSRYADAFVSINKLPREMSDFVKTNAVGTVSEPFEMQGDRNYTIYKYVGATTAPDSIKIQVLPIQSFDPTMAANMADSLKTVLRAGKSFTALAQEMYPSAAAEMAGQWVDEMGLANSGIGLSATKLFDAAKGDVVTTEIQGMTYLVKVDDKTKPVAKAKIAMIRLPIIVSDRTINQIDNKANRFLSENKGKDAAGIAAAANDLGLQSEKDIAVYPNQEFVNNILGTREIIRWAFNDSKGELKKFDTNSERIVAIVTAKTDEGYLPVTSKEVDNVLRAELMRDKKAEKIISNLSGKDLSSLNALAQSIESKVDTAKFITFQTNNINGVGYEPVMNVLSKTGTASATTKPLKGMTGVYVLNVASKTEDSEAYNEDLIKNTLRSSYTQMLAYSASYMLINKMDVKDNRILGY